MSALEKENHSKSLGLRGGNVANASEPVLQIQNRPGNFISQPVEFSLRQL